MVPTPGHTKIYVSTRVHFSGKESPELLKIISPKGL